MSLVEGSIFVLKQSQYYLENISDLQYSSQIGLLSDSTIGQHTRHFIEFYQCLIAQADQRVINYCLRQRDLKLESNTQFAIGCIQDIISQLPNVNLKDNVILYSSTNEEEAIDSTMKRELFYNIEHCIHHLALIKVGLKIIAPQLQLPENFGVAPSTIQHRQQLAQS